MSQSQDKTGVPDTLLYTRCAVPTPLGIAAQLGWFRDEFAADGIAIKVVVDSDNIAERESHYDHSVDNSFRLGGNVPAIWARAGGRDTRLIGLTWTDEFQAVIALPQSGIRTAKDLRGRRLGLPKHESPFIDHGRASALRGFITALALGGLSHRDVELVDLPEPRNSIAEQGAMALSGSVFEVPRRRSSGAALAGLVRGELDAIYVKGPSGLELAHQLGAHVVVDLGGHPDPLVRTNNCTPRTFTVSGGLLDSHPELVERFAARVLAAGDWAREHPEAAVAFIGQETSTAERWVRYGYGREVHQHLHTDLSDTAVEAIDNFKNFLFEWGFLPQNFAIEDWIERGPLAAVQARTQRSVA